jgi:hypothetical protein
MGDTDYTLRRQVGELQNMVVQVNQMVGQVSGQVASVGQKAQETDDRLRKLAQDFESFVLHAQRTANVQRAETRIGVLEAQVDHQFGHHKVVRRSAVGVLQGFDTGLVSEETVRAVSEQLMIQNPRYWLAPVLVALGAWAADERELCDRAVQEAFRRSPGRTSLFMALVLRRQGRRESAVRWLRHYLAAQDPNALGRDFAVILECIAQGAFGPAGLELVQERLDAWRDLLLNDEAKQQAQVDRWRAEVESHTGGPSGNRYPRLAAVSPQWPQMDRVLAAAAAHRPLIDKYSALAAEEISGQDRLEDAVDDILDRLVNEYDDEELPLRRELALNAAVIRHHGDEEASRRDVDADSASLETTLDYLTIQTSSALNPAAIGVSRSTQRIAVASCHEWFARAHAVFTKDYREMLPPNVEAVFESSHNIGATAFKLPRWSGSFTQPMEQLERSLAEHWDRTAQPVIDGMAFDWRRKAILPAVVVVVALVVLTACARVPGFLIALAAGGVWALVLYNQSQAAAKRQQEARDFFARAKQDSITQLRGAGAELTDWSMAFREADSQEQAVRGLIGDLATAGNAASPFESRVVGLGASTGGRP